LLEKPSFVNLHKTLKLKIMFGDMMGMMNKLKETQQKVEATKQRLNTVLIDEASSDQKLKVTITANRTLKSITIDDELLDDKEMLEDYLVLTLNKAIERATHINETEIAAVAKEGMPNIPGLDMFK
jgi:DNA-binding YbaB/EbfC family protein